jgi:hypothetical protein
MFNARVNLMTQAIQRVDSSGEVVQLPAVSYYPVGAVEVNIVQCNFLTALRTPLKEENLLNHYDALPLETAFQASQGFFGRIHVEDLKAVRDLDAVFQAGSDVDVDVDVDVDGSVEGCSKEEMEEMLKASPVSLAVVTEAKTGIFLSESKSKSKSKSLKELQLDTDADADADADTDADAAFGKALDSTFDSTLLGDFGDQSLDDEDIGAGLILLALSGGLTGNSPSKGHSSQYIPKFQNIKKRPHAATALAFGSEAFPPQKARALNECECELRACNGVGKS